MDSGSRCSMHTVTQQCDSHLPESESRDRLFVARHEELQGKNDGGEQPRNQSPGEYPRCDVGECEH